MLDTKIKEEVQKLSTTDRLALIEFTSTLLKKDILQKEVELKDYYPSLTSLIRNITSAGEEAISNGAKPLPSDFASKHDIYIYKKSNK